MRDQLRSIPSTDICLRRLLGADASLGAISRDLLRDLVTAFWDGKRRKILANNISPDESMDLDSQWPQLLAHVRESLEPRLRRVINATGVVIHTNLGRSILAPEAVEAVKAAAENYCSLEMDLDTGERGSRQNVIDGLLRHVTGAEAAMAVNNNAAAVLLLLDTFCGDGETIVSRGELVEIGGSFRIPDIMAKSGATLREVGTTNKTRLSDYENSITENTRAIMRVHQSNFRITGFQSAVDLPSLKALAQEHGLLLLVDLGSGALLDFSERGLPPEPVVRDVLASGADCVCFSGDKALGGPQAGIIAGKKELIERLQKNPLTRALRCDKLCLAALEATLRLYLNPATAWEKVPTPVMIGRSPEDLAQAAKTLAAMFKRRFARDQIECDVKLEKNISRVGGGAFPECDLPTTLICLRPAQYSASRLKQALLRTKPPLIGRMEDGAFCMDPRTMAKADYRLAVEVVAGILKN